ncbi:hypothetical protein JHK87_047870 [Glycine soja]|nr:hypothetical protein JHK87_047870 [Glycine soja]|eukprot:XP_014625083.1 probable WRKY transcription factor 11 [Glycine max]
MNFQKQDEQKAIEEATMEGLKGMDNLIQILSHHPSYINTELANIIVSKFKKLNALLNRTGHARFRRTPIHSTAPVHSTNPVHNASTSSTQVPLSENPNLFALVQSPVPVQVHRMPASVALDFMEPHNPLISFNAKSVELEFSKETFNVPSKSSFISPAITNNGNVSNKEIFLASAPPTTSVEKVLAFKKQCYEHHEQSVDISGSSKCHYLKQRYTTFHQIITLKLLTSTLKKNIVFNV